MDISNVGRMQEIVNGTRTPPNHSDQDILLLQWVCRRLLWAYQTMGMTMSQKGAAVFITATLAFKGGE